MGTNQAIAFAEWIGESGLLWVGEAEVWVDGLSGPTYTTEELFITFMETQP